MLDKLVDRSCALLDGICDCYLAIENCKYLENLRNSVRIDALKKERDSVTISRANDAQENGRR